MGAPKITDENAMDWAVKHIRTAFEQGVPLELGKTPSSERLDLYRRTFNIILGTMNGGERAKFEFFGQMASLIPPPYARKNASW